MEIKIEKGIGFVSSEARKKEKREIGVMLLDSIFTPCKRVSIKVENMRVGERTDFDKLLLEIETDGTITPEVAFFKASEILTDHFSFIMEAFRKEAEEKPVLAIKEKKKKVIKKEVKSKQANLKKRTIGIKKHAQKKKGKKTK